MKELIERLEKATGPDRGLDGDIAEALGLSPKIVEGTYRGLANAAARNCWFKNGFVIYDAPKFTESLDAAMTLVPEGMYGAVQCWTGYPLDLGRSEATVRDQYQSRAHSRADTPALALCIASLKARTGGSHGY